MLGLQDIATKRRLHVSSPRVSTTTPPIFMAFDCLLVGGRDLREQAARACARWPKHGAARATARRRRPQGWAQVLERGDEGLVAKDPASPYRGGRTLAWLKVKVPHYREAKRGWEPNSSWEPKG